MADSQEDEGDLAATTEAGATSAAPEPPKDARGLGRLLATFTIDELTGTIRHEKKP